MRDFLPPKEVALKDTFIASPPLKQTEDENLVSKAAMDQMGQAQTNREPAAPSPSLMKPQSVMPSLSAGQSDLAKSGQLMQEAAKQEAGAFEYKAAEAQNIESEAQKQRGELELRQQKQREDFERRGQEIDNDIDTFKIDPNKMWSNMSTGNKVLAGLSIFLGGFDPSGQNKALGIIQNSIDRDIDAQKASYMKLRDKKQEMNSLYGRMMDKFKDEKIALDMTKAGHYQALGMKVEAMAAQAKVPQVQAQYLQQAAVFKQKAAEMGADAYNKFLSAQQKGASQYVPGFGTAPTEKEAQDLRAKVAAADSARQEIANLESLSKLGTKFSPEDAAKAQMSANLLKAALRKEIVGEGAVSEGEYKILDSVIADPSKFFSLSSTQKATLKYLENKVLRGLQNTAKSYGLETPEQYRPKTDFSSRKI
jgi:hypothetical protein